MYPVFFVISAFFADPRKMAFLIKISQMFQILEFCEFSRSQTRGNSAFTDTRMAIGSKRVHPIWLILAADVKNVIFLFLLKWAILWSEFLFLRFQKK